MSTPAMVAPIEPGASAGSLWRDRRLWAIVALAFLLGLIVSLRYLHEDMTLHGSTGDQIEYHALAKALIARGHFESTYRAPGYPVFVALVYLVCGPRSFAVYVVQSILFALSIAMVAGVFEQATGRRAVALAAALLSACYPRFPMVMIPQLMSETLAMFLVAAFLLLLYSTLSRGRWWKAAVLGVVFVAATLTKAVLLPFAGLAALCLFWCARDRRSGAWQALVFLITTALCLAPWTWRNWRETGAFLPVSTGGGVAFWLGNYEGYYDVRVCAKDLVGGWPLLSPELQAATRGMSEVSRDQYLKRVALNYLRQDPARALRVCWTKFSETWLGGLGRDVRSYLPGAARVPAVGHFSCTKTAMLATPLLLLGLTGIGWLTPAQRVRALPMLMLLAWWALIYLVMVGGERYSFPVYPYLLGLATLPLLALGGRLLALLPRRGSEFAKSPLL